MKTKYGNVTKICVELNYTYLAKTPRSCSQILFCSLAKVDQNQHYHQIDVGIPGKLVYFNSKKNPTITCNLYKNEEKIST